MEASAQQCDNCHTLLHGDFCHQCGQEKKNYVDNIVGVIAEFLGEFSNWDNRLWRTLWPLWFRPGYLSGRYVRGHRTPYVPPLRMYLFTSIIAFLIMAKLVPEAAFDPRVEAEGSAEIIEQHSLEVPFLSDAAQQQVNQQFSAFIERPTLALNKFFALAPQMMFILLPIFALLLKLLYIRSDRYYMEHLIMALYSHSFILQVGVFYLLLGALRSNLSWPWLATFVGWLETAFLYWIPVYLFLSQKFYYQQSWIKTLVKYSMTTFIYGILFFSAFVSVIVLSVLWM